MCFWYWGSNWCGATSTDDGTVRSTASHCSSRGARIYFGPLAHCCILSRPSPTQGRVSTAGRRAGVRAQPSSPRQASGDEGRAEQSADSHTPLRSTCELRLCSTATFNSSGSRDLQARSRPRATNVSIWQWSSSRLLDTRHEVRTQWRAEQRWPTGNCRPMTLCMGRWQDVHL